MQLLNAKTLLLAAVTLDAVTAHTSFTNFYVDGAPQGDGTCVRMSNDIPKATNPIRPITSQDMACGVNGDKGVARICPANSGSQLTFNFRDWPDGSQPGSLDKSHMGPCSVYMKKVDNSAADNNAAGPGWFKIFEDDYDNSTAQWCTSKIMANDGKLSVNVPTDLAGGYYLVRPELLALHEADKSPPDPQFYVGCAQIFLQSTGSAVPKDTVSIPGYVSMQDPAMTFHIWDAPKQLYFPQFSPATYRSGSSKRDIETRTDQLKQTFGLKPADCIMENDNWCGLTLPSYSDENGYRPQDLLSSPAPQHLIPYTIHHNPEPVYATTFHPSFALQDPASALYVASLRALPIRLLSPFSPSIIASYPLISITTEEYIAPHSVLFSPYDPKTFFAGSLNLIATFDINRNGEEPVARMPTIPSKRSKVVGGVGGIKGIISALGMSPEGVLAAGTFSRWIGLYDGQGRGGSVGAFQLGEEAGTTMEADGTGVTQVLWSNDGRYLCVAERCSDEIGIWDIRGTGKKLASLRGRNAVTNQRMSVDVMSSEVWAGGVDGMVRVWGKLGMNEGTIDPTWEFKAHGGMIPIVILS
ncbi:MAG: hypothetical protein Q9218_001765 [Villophora microphyllina]